MSMDIESDCRQYGLLLDVGNQEIKDDTRRTISLCTCGW